MGINEHVRVNAGIKYLLKNVHFTWRWLTIPLILDAYSLYDIHLLNNYLIINVMMRLDVLSTSLIETLEFELYMQSTAIKISTDDTVYLSKNKQKSI